MAWLLTVPTGYIIKAEESLEFGLEQLRDILEVPHMRGMVVDTKLGELKLKIVAMLDTRVKGAPITKTMNLHANVSTEAVQKIATASTEADLMRQLKELERMNRKAQNLPLTEEDVGHVPGEGVKPDIQIS
jgi:hypothetical protein